MNENIDLTKILKDCPVGTKLYSIVYGEVEFIKVLHDNPVPLHEYDDEWHFPEIQKYKYPIKLMSVMGEYFVTREGRHLYNSGECALFPSKEQRDWSKFTAPWYKKERFDHKTLKPFDKVLVRDSSTNWRCTFYSHTIENRNSHFKYKFVTDNSVFEYCIPYNEDTKHLVGTAKKAPEYYRYWED